MQRTDYSRPRTAVFDRSSIAIGLGAAALAMAPILVDGSTVGAAPFAIVTPQNSTSYLSDEPVLDKGNTISLILPTRSLVEGWTDGDQKRFRELAIEEAVGELNQEERAELEQLTAQRRAFEHPRSGDEILWEFEQRRRTKDLLKFLRRYVEFYEGANPAWSGAGKDLN